MFLAAEAAQILRDPSQFERFAALHGEDVLVAALVRHGIAPFVAWRRPALAALAKARRESILEDAIQVAELRRLLAALTAAAIPVLVFKGSAWAFTVYPASWCRPRADFDLLIPLAERQRAHAVLVAAGYRRDSRISGALANFQDAFHLTVAGGYLCTVDLHWEIANRLSVVQRLPAAELLARSQLLEPLGPGVRQLDVVDAVLLAGLHPLTHHPDEVELKWWLDIVRLAQTMTRADASALSSRASERGVARIMAYALAEARQCAGTDETDAPVLQESFIRGLAAQGEHEQTAGLLEQRRGQLDDLLSDLGALPTWGARARLLGEHLLPPASFMLEMYGTQHRRLLPVLYVHRAVSGGLRWASTWLRERVTRFRA